MGTVARALLAALLIGLVAAVAIVLATRGADPEPSPDPPAAEPTPAAPSESPSEEPLRVVTPANTPELRTLLEVDDYCDASVAQFAAAYAGRSVRFDGSVSAINVYGDTADIGLAAGDDGVASTDGPAFRVTGIDVNAPEPANLVDVVVDGTYRITAEVVAFDPSSCLLELRPTRVVPR